MTVPAGQPEELTRHAAALRRIALAMLGDEAAADDVVQGAYLKALQRPSGVTSLAWMSRVVRNRAIDLLRRKRARQDGEAGAGTDSPSGPGPGEVAERMESYRLLSEAIGCVAEPYQEVIYLRFYEGLQPQQIADRKRMPVKSVRTRLYRALEKLRERLERRFGQGPDALRAALLAPLGKVAAIATTPTGPAWTLFGGAVLMTKLSLIPVAATALAVSAFFVFRTDPADPIADLEPITMRDENGLSSDRVRLRGSAANDQDRLVVSAESGSDGSVDPVAGDATGSLLIRALRADGTPVAGLEIYVMPEDYDGEWSGLARQRTDERGELLVPELSPGKLRVGPLRGFHALVQDVTVATGAPTLVELTLPDGIRVTCKVVDPAGRKVAGAQLWVATGMGSWVGGEIVGTTDASGMCELEGVDPGTGIGALAPGFRRSLLVDLDLIPKDRDPLPIELALRPSGASLSGRVVDPEGAPVEGAWICLGRPVRHFDWHHGMDGMVEVWTPLTARTDADGNFALHGMPRATHPLEVRADGYPLWKTDVELAQAESEPMRIELVPGFSLFGVVTDGQGQKVPGAVVRAYDEALDQSFIQGGQFDYYGAFGFPMTRTGAGGEYRLDSLRCVPTHVYATLPAPRKGRPRTPVMRAHEVITAAPGDEVRWDPVIEEGLVIRGRVSYSNGEPVSGVFVTARNEETSVRQTLMNGADGTFRFVNMSSGAHSLGVQVWDSPPGSEPIEAASIYPGPDEIQLVASFQAPRELEPGVVTGIVEDVAGRLAGVDQLRAILRYRHRSAWRDDVTIDEMHFRFDEIPPGEYRAVVFSGEVEILQGEWFELLPGETHDLGILETQPGGRLLLTLERSELPEDVDSRVTIVREGAANSWKIPPGPSPIPIENLSAGTYKLSAWAPGMVSVKEFAEVVAGKDNAVTLRLRAGALTPYSIQWPDGHVLGYLTMVIRDASGQELWNLKESNASALPRPYVRSCHLPVGTFELSAETGSGLRGAISFSVDDLAGEQEPVELVLE